MEGLTRNIYEIFELIMAIALLLIIGGAILSIADSNRFQAELTATELSYISTMISNTDMIIYTNYDDTLISNFNNVINIDYKKSKQNKSYFAGIVDIYEINPGEKYMICSSGRCNSNSAIN